jgi:hypothetical protein
LTVANARWVGLDVHARETACALVDQSTGEVASRKVSGRPEAVLEWLERLDRPFVAVYEAGPTGYGLARAAAARGLDVRVCAPGAVPLARDRIKTDTRDAMRLARLLAAGELRSVRVPRPEEEHLRDLVRAREAVRMDLARARHRIAKFLLRRSIYFRAGARTWTVEHRTWLRSLGFDDRPSELVFADLLHGHDVLLDAATGSTRRLRWQQSRARGQTPSRGFAACEAWTPSRRLGCVPRSPTSAASTTLATSAPT